MSRAFDLAEVLTSLDELERATDTWSEEARDTLLASRQLNDSLQREAWARLLAGLREDPACRARLRELMGDEIIYAVLRRFGLLKASLDERIHAALVPVRPLLQAHGGDVEILEIEPPDTVRLRMTGACEGCPASAVTLTAGVIRAIRTACPEITRVQEVSEQGPPGADPDIVSPFAKTS